MTSSENWKNTPRKIPEKIHNLRFLNRYSNILVDVADANLKVRTNMKKKALGITPKAF
jgi:hypothetical protein